ncbi:unnamed protein product [Ectocarpus fasciculatus]
MSSYIYPSIGSIDPSVHSSSTSAGLLRACRLRATGLGMKNTYLSFGYIVRHLSRRRSHVSLAQSPSISYILAMDCFVKRRGDTKKTRMARPAYRRTPPLLVSSPAGTLYKLARNTAQIVTTCSCKAADQPPPLPSATNNFLSLPLLLTCAEYDELQTLPGNGHDGRGSDERLLSRRNLFFPARDTPVRTCRCFFSLRFSSEERGGGAATTTRRWCIMVAATTAARRVLGATSTTSTAGAEGCMPAPMLLL